MRDDFIDLHGRELLGWWDISLREAGLRTVSDSATPDQLLSGEILSGILACGRVGLLLPALT